MKFMYRLIVAAGRFAVGIATSGPGKTLGATQPLRS